MQRRVVVTGLGVLSPIGQSFQESWQNLILGKCGITRLTTPDYANLPCRVAGLILNPDGTRFALDRHFSKTELKSISPATAYALLATREALTDAHIVSAEGNCVWDERSKDRVGVAVGMGMVDLVDVCTTWEALNKGYRQVSPFFVPRILANMAAGQISIKYGFRGPNHSVSTACATGAHAIGDSFRFIRNNDADVMVCGGSEACVSPLAIAAFCRLRALSTSFNDQPNKSSRPFDKDRDGFVMGEGSAILVLEELNHALSRGANIYAEILGYGLSGDASHLTAPRADGSGAIMAMQRALTDAHLYTSDVTYVNAHATSTPLGDIIESKAIRILLGSVAVSSTKGAHGHLLGAAGNLEAAFTVKAIEEGVIPPTLNLDEVDDEVGLTYIKVTDDKRWSTGRKGVRRVALKNAFGFGGTNASLCIGQYLTY